MRTAIYWERSDLARRANISTSTVLRDISLGLIEPIARTVRGSRLFAESDVVEYLRARERRRGGGGGGGGRQSTTTA